MVDFVKLLLIAGNGGNGRVSFRREKFVQKGGPDGGDGGKGGNIIFRCSDKLSTLGHLAGKKKYLAENGGFGGGRNKYGANGEDEIIEVPVGTTLWVLGENISAHYRRIDPVGAKEKSLTKFTIEKIGAHMPPTPQDKWQSVAKWIDRSDDSDYGLSTERSLHQSDFRTIPKYKHHEFTKPGEELVVCMGGHGGRGNSRFASSTNTTPLTAEFGESGEQRVVVLEMKLLADVGLVGLPNAGKSTLLSVVTKARPKIASYPFTTLEPQLGIMQLPGNKEKTEVVLADIPGLIEGASEGRGLGYAFLRHIENCRALVYYLGLPETANADMTAKEIADELYATYTLLKKELESYATSLVAKPTMVVINKIDLVEPNLIKEVVKLLAKKLGKDVMLQPISAATRQGLTEFANHLATLLR